MRLSILWSLFLGGLAYGATIDRRNDHVVHEKRSGAPLEWSKHRRAPASQILPMRIGLKQRNLEHADRFIYEITDPSSSRYGKHWTAEQVANMFAPSQETIDRTKSWLSDFGITEDRLSFSTGRNWIEFDSTVDEAERLLDTKYHLFRHNDGGYRAACDSYSVRKDVKDHIDFVMPTVQLDGLKPVARKSPALSATVPISGLTGLQQCDRLITIDCLRALYNFGPGNYSHPDNKMGIAEWADYLYYPDLKTFFQNFTSPKIPSNTLPEFISIDGGKMSNLSVARDGEVVESALDFQSAYSIIWPQNTRQYQVGDSVNVDSVGTFNIFLDALDASYCTYQGGDQPYVDPAYPDPNEGGYTGPLQCGGAPVSKVISFSYGQIEAALPRFYQERQCHEWMKLGLQGVSIVFASGDSGVANRYNSGYNNSCVNSKYGYVDTYGTQFSPSFPVNCPYVLAVGATQLKGHNISEGEVAVAEPDNANHLLDFYSGGGFSNIFPRPSYQDAQVEHYLKTYAPKYNASVYNHKGRGFPDVAAMGLNVTTVYLNRTLGVGGTSASAPIFASLLNLINEERLRVNKTTVGFVNPVLYKHPDAFNDITSGANPGCGTQGFPASKGWDAVTGLGTPNYEKLKQIFLSLP